MIMHNTFADGRKPEIITQQTLEAREERFQAKMNGLLLTAIGLM